MHNAEGKIDLCSGFSTIIPRNDTVFILSVSVGVVGEKCFVKECRCEF